MEGYIFQAEDGKYLTWQQTNHWGKQGFNVGYTPDINAASLSLSPTPPRGVVPPKKVRSLRAKVVETRAVTIVI